MVSLHRTGFLNSIAAFHSPTPKVSTRLRIINAPSFRHLQSTMHLRDGKSVESTNGTSGSKVSSTDTMAYTNCTTRIIDLSPLKLPNDPKTPDSKLCEMYREYTNTHGSQSSATRHATHRPRRRSSSHSKPHPAEFTKTQQADSLVAAILSLKTGIAPPVAFPTETVYGLGADATNQASVAGIFAAKGRPSDNPLIVHVSSTDHLERCLGGTETQSAIPEVYKDLMKEFWPGPLTVLIPVPEDGKGVKFAANVHPGQKTIGFRVPSSLHARFLLAVTDRPIAAPSANSSGKPSPTTAQHVKDDLDGKINFILDGGRCDVGVESTVVDGLGETPLILRPGGVSKSALRAWGRKQGNIWQHVENGWERPKTGAKRRRSDPGQSNGESKTKVQKLVNGTDGANGDDIQATAHDEDRHGLERDTDLPEAPRAPGMKYKHYAPKARMFLFESSSSGDEPDFQPVYAKLKELLSARHPEPNDRTIHFLRDGDASLKDTEMVRGPTHSLSIGLLPSTSWTRIANNIEQALIDGLHPDWKVDGGGHTDVHCIHDVNVSTQLSVKRLEDSYTEKQVRLENIDLGEDSATISRNLFAALRTCDDVGCDWIFAEAPSRAAIKDEKNGSDGNVDEDEFETVLERLRKAATEIVYC